MKFFVFIGINTNSIIVIFLINYENISLDSKMKVFILMENFLVILYLVISYNPLPRWFKYVDKLKFNYLLVTLNFHKSSKNINENNSNDNFKN